MQYRVSEFIDNLLATPAAITSFILGCIAVIVGAAKAITTFDAKLDSMQESFESSDRRIRRIEGLLDRILIGRVNEED